MSKTTNALQAEKKHVVIAGGGWNGAHLACELAEEGYKVTLVESNKRVFSGISGTFGIRTHVGTHYPRSEETRKHCLECLAPFIEKYPELTNKHLFAIYALGIKDLTGHASKVSEDEFRKVCEEVPGWHDIPKQDLHRWGMNPYTNHMAADMPEPTMILGERLRTFFEKRLADRGVTVRTNARVTRAGKETAELNNSEIVHCDFFINTTSCKELFPPAKELPFDVKIIYQVCLALKFTYGGNLFFVDKKTGERRELDPNDPNAIGSFITMDGWYPCWMPYDNRTQKEINEGKGFDQYIGTHGKLTIAGSYATPGEAYNALNGVEDGFMENVIQTIYRKHMGELWSAFSDATFEYEGYASETLAKIVSRREFRSTLPFMQNKTGIIHVIPGKITNVIDLTKEVKALLAGKNLISDPKGLATYVQGGALDAASKKELREEITDPSRNTAYLNTFEELRRYFRKKNMTHIQAKEHIESFATATDFYKALEASSPRMGPASPASPPPAHSVMAADSNKKAHTSEEQPPPRLKLPDIINSKAVINPQTAQDPKSVIRAVATFFNNARDAFREAPPPNFTLHRCSILNRRAKPRRNRNVTRSEPAKQDVIPPIQQRL